MGGWSWRHCVIVAAGGKAGASKHDECVDGGFDPEPTHSHGAGSTQPRTVPQLSRGESNKRSLQTR